MSLRILVIDAAVRETQRLRALLETAGHTVYTAQTAGAGFDLAQHELPEFVVIDAALPDLPGLELLRQLRGDPCTKGIMVLISSASLTDDELFRACQLGADFQRKRPMEAADLLGILAFAERVRQQRS